MHRCCQGPQLGPYTRSHKEELEDALSIYEKRREGTDDVIRTALGEHAFESIYAARKADWFNYKTHVTKWEYDKYLSTY